MGEFFEEHGEGVYMALLAVITIPIMFALGMPFRYATTFGVMVYFALLVHATFDERIN